MIINNRGGGSLQSSKAIKGIALIMMVYDHMFLYPERIVIQDPFVNIYIYLIIV